MCHILLLDMWMSRFLIEGLFRSYQTSGPSFPDLGANRKSRVGLHRFLLHYSPTQVIPRPFHVGVLRSLSTRLRPVSGGPVKHWLVATVFGSPRPNVRIVGVHRRYPFPYRRPPSPTRPSSAAPSAYGRRPPSHPFSDPDPAPPGLEPHAARPARRPTTGEPGPCPATNFFSPSSC